MIDLDARALTDALARLERACDDLAGVAQQASAEALGHAVIGARRNVYDTTPGAYERTGDYLRGFQARGQGTKNTARVSVWNDVPYAPYIEYGTGPYEMPLAQIVAQAAANPLAPLHFGRSGQRYMVAGPAVYPAAVFALYRMRELFAGKVRGAR